MKKKVYQSPQTELFEIKLEGALLNTSVGSVQTMTEKSGYWDTDDEYDY